MKLQLTKIKVTQKDIDSGRSGCKVCPIALALHRKLDPIIVVTPSRIPNVSAYSIAFKYYDKIDEERKYIYIDLPKVAVNFIRDFDRNGKSAVKPFEFEIEVPENQLKKAASVAAD